MKKYPHTHKMDAGFKVYNEYQIQILFFDKEEIQANVISPSNKAYFVTCSVGYWRCTCWDWNSMWQRIEGAYNCKHIEAVHFHLTNLKLQNSPITTK